MQTQTIKISGTNCMACKKLIEKRILTIADVVDVDVDFKTGKTLIEANRLISKPEINEALEGLPYGQKD